MFSRRVFLASGLFMAAAMMVFWLPLGTHSLPTQKQARIAAVSDGLTSIVLRPARSVMIHQARVVLANTRKTGSPLWGLTVAEADQACQAIAKAENEKAVENYQQSRTLLHPFVDAFLDRLLNVKDSEPKVEVEEVQGHLLSIRSKEELASLIKALVWTVEAGGADAGWCSRHWFVSLCAMDSQVTDQTDS
nr:unnamed protein product [Spirometra erinaceieuropaei]